jgi:tetratricopeptide (TPR) repeat protein
MIRIMTWWLGLIKSARNSYRPELHYMRGPGPKWYAKHQGGTENGQLCRRGTLARNHRDFLHGSRANQRQFLNSTRSQSESMPGTARFVFGVAAVAATLLSATLPAKAQTQQQIDGCFARGDPDARIYGCTALIQSGSYYGDRLAGFFYNRGTAYSDKGQFERGIQDFDQAIRISPQFAEAYNNRCYTAAKLDRELQRALSDCNISLQLRPNNAYTLGSRGLVYQPITPRRAGGLKGNRQRRL